MRRATLSTVIGPATGAILMALIAGCERPSEGKAAHAAGSALPMTRVEVVRPERHTVRRSVGEPGELQAFETTAIHAKIPGYVKEWTVNIGAQVKKGQVLVELSVPEMESDVQQKKAMVALAVAKDKQAGDAVRTAAANVAGAEAKLAEVRAGIKRVDADLVRWQAEYKRVEQLFQERAQTGSLLDETRNKLRASEATRDEVQAQVATAEVAVTQVRAARDQADSDLGAAAAAIKVAEEDARHAEALLGYAKIEAPFDGIVTQRNVNTGDLTQSGADKPPLFIVARSDIVTIRVNVPEAFAAAVNPGDRADVKLQELKGKIVEGKVSRISWALDPKTRTIRVEIDIPNPGGKLLPGLYAYATVIVEEHPDVLTVPMTAVVKEKDKSYCVAVVEGKAVRRPIEVGLSDGTWTEILSGLVGDEVVAKANAASLADGQPVESTESANPPPSGAKP
jgi:RND family efflux transporter MFP subunit